MKWIRLSEVINQIAQQKVELVMSLQAESDHRAALLKREDRIVIYLNMAYNKTDEEIIESVAHELAHLKVQKHTNQFYQEYEKLKLQIKNKMEV
jgi:predicted metal-dependent hydrolase